MLVEYTNGVYAEKKNIDFALEKDLQKFFETNIEKITGYRFLVSEFAVDDYRMDSVAFDEESNAFIIVEYKRGKNESLVDQGYAYLNKLLNRKADFVLLYNEVTGQVKGKKDFDWSQTRIVFVSPKFTKNQVDATSFNEMAFELYEVKRFEGGLYLIEQLHQNKSTKINQKEIKKCDIVEKSITAKVNEEIKVYDEEYHFSNFNVSDEIKALYLELKAKIYQEYPDFSEKYNKFYIAFKNSNNKNIVSFWFKHNWIEVVLHAKQGELKDYSETIYDISNRKWSNAQYALKMKLNTNLEDIMYFIRQVVSL